MDKRTIFLIGLNFSSKTRRLKEWEIGQKVVKEGGLRNRSEKSVRRVGQKVGLEDRVVKQWFKALAETWNFSLVYKKAVQPTYQEIQKNRPSRSAKYRVIEKI